MIESGRHDLWFSGRQGIFRVAAGGLKHAEEDRESPLEYSSFGPDDGMNSKECDGWDQPHMAMTSDDTLWVATVKGLARLDRQRFQSTNHKPAIYVEEVDVGRTKASPCREFVLPPGTYHVEFHFTAVDPVSPEKIRHQYRLDGVDPLWLDADSTRTAIYNSIPVGAHSFHIRASNRDGVWDRSGIVYSVIQEPFLYETTWFRLSVVADPKGDTRELFRRIVFNALISNIDDHPRNHALIAPERSWRLSPAYDLTPALMVSQDWRNLAVECGNQGRFANKTNILSEHARFLLDREEAKKIVAETKEQVSKTWEDTVLASGASHRDVEAIRSAFVYPGFSQ